MLVPGMLVGLPRGQGVGKLVSTRDGRCTVSIFYSILRSETLEFAFEDITRGYLSSQTRVYVKQNEYFKVGRVTNRQTKY